MVTSRRRNTSSLSSNTFIPTLEQYERLQPKYDSLRQEVCFMISESVEEIGIKIHALESRTKTYESLKKKIGSKIDQDFGDIVDVVGIRLITLFKSDLSKIDQILEDRFDVLSKDDKITTSSDTFGYMSVHYVCQFPYRFNGPRYKLIAGEIFEVQVRTLCMHAWAAVSHYLDYKSDSDIPDDLKKGLNALSGLFYVADEQYENLYQKRLENKIDSSAKNINELFEEDLNLDSFSAYIRAKFPDHGKSELDAISILLRNLRSFGYTKLKSIDESVEQGLTSALKMDSLRMKESLSSEHVYFDLAMTRLSIKSGDTNFARFEDGISRHRIVRNSRKQKVEPDNTKGNGVI